ncbi:lysophospholipid acyltransferase LPEAT1-like isoform X2 [Impatiens glandulifera]|uniref:lysophospholipid acyltransferase LPEAT1-like isoform X2 n=1 Tax=Impatiens glandulifera TaxID=253017 RepID=UPI001FB08ED9|nr:lysophospholipid acyltransferase LPEAT1-like isoform X2 [Impatiens glandulifera]
MESNSSQRSLHPTNNGNSIESYFLSFSFSLHKMEKKEQNDLNPPSNPQPPPHDQEEDDDRPLLKPDRNNSDHSSPSPPSETIEELEKKYGAFTRNDVYGTMGRGELRLVEKVITGVALVTLVPLRVVSSIAFLVFYYLICCVCTLFSTPNRNDDQEDYAHIGGWRRFVVVKAGSFLARVVLFIMGFYWIKEIRRDEDVDGGLTCQGECKDQTDDSGGRQGVIISNHVSYLDILYTTSCFFPSFVAKKSVAKLPLVGLICKCLGCVFVQRESKSSNVKGVSGVVNERIREAHENEDAPLILLFPEGTTTNGNYLLPFKTGAFIAKAPVRPLILRYPYQRFSPSWESISGVRHILILLCQFVNYLEVIRLPVYHPSQQEKDDPKLYAENVRRMMAREGNMSLSDIGLAEKRIYHAALNGFIC